jgi:predicted RNA-binding protein with PIN domain
LLSTNGEQEHLHAISAASVFKGNQRQIVFDAGYEKSTHWEIGIYYVSYVEWTAPLSDPFHYLSAYTKGTLN